MHVKSVIEEATKGGIIHYQLNAKIGQKDAVALESLLFICDEWKKLTGNDCTLGETLDILDDARWFLLTEAVAKAGNKP